MYKNGIVPFQPPENRFRLFRRAPKLKFPDGEQLRDEVFILAQVTTHAAVVVHFAVHHENTVFFWEDRGQGICFRVQADTAMVSNALRRPPSRNMLPCSG